MKRLINKVFCCLAYLLATFFIAMQIAYFLSFNYDIDRYMASPRFCFDPKILYWQNNYNYLKVSSLIILVGLFSIAVSLFTPTKAEREQRRKERHLDSEEKLEYSHIASKHEIKKGLQRIQYNKKGDLDHLFTKKPDNPQARILIILGNLLWFIVLMSTTLVIKNECMSVYAKLIGQESANNSILLIVVLVTSLLMFSVLCRFHIRDYMDYSFDYSKKLYNKAIWKMKLPQKRLLNTLKYWTVIDQQSNRRAGLPILTTKRKTWVDASDVHSGVVGSTNSGKTYSVYHHMIELSRMAKESMFINDIKGDLAEQHRWQLEHDGYDILRIDFIHPELSIRWNPFGKVVRSYREAQKRVHDAVTNPDEWSHYEELKKDLIRTQSRIMNLYRKKDQVTDPQQQVRIEQMIRNAEKNTADFKRRIVQCEQAFISTYGDAARIRYGDTFEQLATICKAVCEEKNAKQPHFWQMAQAMMEGIICFLLEYEYIDESGELRQLDERQINFKNIKQVKIEGFDYYQINGKSQTIIGYYLQNYRKTTDKSVEKLTSILATGSEERGSIFTTFDNKIALGTIDDRICEMMSETSFDWDDIIQKPTAIFMIVHSEKNLYYPFVTLFFNQLYEEMVRISRNHGGRLPRSFSFIWDEFGVSPAVPDIESKFNTCRSMGMRLMVAFQDYAQIEKQYGKDDAKAIESALSNTVYLLSNSQDTRKKIEGMCGKKLRWNKEKGTFDSVPTISEDRLRNLSLSEAVIIQQRKMPYITRYYPYDSYIYKNHFQKPAKLVPHELPAFEIFSLQEELIKMQKLGISSNSGRTKQVLTTNKSISGSETEPDDKPIQFATEKSVTNEMLNILDTLSYE